MHLLGAAAEGRVRACVRACVDVHACVCVRAFIYAVYALEREVHVYLGVPIAK